MPLILEPNATYKVILKTDKDKTPAPTFLFKRLSGRQWIDIATKSDEFDNAADIKAKLGICFDAIRLALVGWENMTEQDGTDIIYNPSVLEDILTIGEGMELMQAAVAQLPTAEEKKTLESPLDSSMGLSAPDVLDLKNAVTVPVPPSQ